ncbi:hypothetical protein CJ307_33165, partial [Klebsiella quasipneumoniae]
FYLSGLTSSWGMPQTDTANVIPELAGGWNDGLACFIFRFLKRPLFVYPNFNSINLLFSKLPS